MTTSFFVQISSSKIHSEAKIPFDLSGTLFIIDVFERSSIPSSLTASRLREDATAQLSLFRLSEMKVISAITLWNGEELLHSHLAKIQEEEFSCPHSISKRDKTVHVAFSSLRPHGGQLSGIGRTLFPY
ncbi:hypothetical protein DICVIV_02080 [Dictyocaulus viviparus]|uniref:Uncharacterized protein n=1 Tax=Dictyocaulus viviparus TaxID=29172 RepID=A0A0D8Y4J3_DICVI|nr:hypothetical protein DICVIV_02080 [Dictyocaulus viviparus]